MKEQKKKIFTWRINLFLFIIFSMGSIFGVAIYGTLGGVIQNYIASRSQVIEQNSYVDVETSVSYATPANATWANATWGNATWMNASSTDARNDFMILTQLTTKYTTAKAGEKIEIELYTYGNCLNGASITFHCKDLGLGFTSQVDFEDGKKFITIPEEAVAGRYEIENVMLFGTSYAGGTFTRTYDAKEIDNPFALNVEKSASAKDIELQSVSLDKSEAKISENVKVTLKTDVEVTSAKFTFENTSNSEKAVVYLKSENDEKCISFSSTTKEGEYELTNLVLSDGTTSTIYSKQESSSAKQFNFNTKIKVAKADTEDLEFNNEDITAEIVKQIADSDTVKRLVINADTKSLISEDIFNAIKGKNIELVVNYKGNQFIFNGRDIDIAKDIDVSVKSYSLATKNDELKSLVGDSGIILTFASNGSLPSTATLKIKRTPEMKTVLGIDKVYVYYFDEQTLKFEEVAKNLLLDAQNYYTFKIDHNSKFLLTNNQLDESLIQKEDGNIVSFLMESKVYLILIILGVVLIVIVLVVLIVYNKNKKNKKRAVVTVDNTKKSEEKVEQISQEEKNEENISTRTGGQQ